MQTPNPNPSSKETKVSTPDGQPLPNVLARIVDLIIENRIRIDAIEQIVVKTNPVAYELYLGMIENLQAQQMAEVNRLLSG
jgi:hypothetical protein